MLSRTFGLNKLICAFATTHTININLSLRRTVSSLTTVPEKFFVAGGGLEHSDLKVMSLASYQLLYPTIYFKNYKRNHQISPWILFLHVNYFSTPFIVHIVYASHDILDTKTGFEPALPGPRPIDSPLSYSAKQNNASQYRESLRLIVLLCGRGGT